MFDFFANTFGYVLNLLYNLLNNYGLAIILFTILIKIILLPISIKQQRTMKKSAKLQEQMKSIQFKYKNDPEKMNQEIMSLYKSENMSPMSGCLSSIIQLILLLSIFYLVKSPLTYMRKIPTENLNNYVKQMQDEGKNVNNVYPEIDIIREKGPENEEVRLNMEFLGLDLSEIPQQSMSDYRVYIIPGLYIISTFISMRLTTSMQAKAKKKKDVIELDADGKPKADDSNEVDVAMQTNKMMSWMMPIMSISIAFIAPLGLALYWLINNILMIIERLVLDRILKEE
ncbi:membrane protein insertase YidC/Oxa1 family [Clostridium sp. CAG:440]|jgi:YidC/Oxa1 family membrane protein insertase|nr:membrane protein insertase YidC/Oxa1 family [Clostridium sp. CAG:440]HJJ15325.1 YidC/Oxa1 family membrane protein insertase [Clostridiaceae bacterium]